MMALIATAFATGMLAPINPCGFALLPAYLAYQPTAIDTRRDRITAGLKSGIAVTAGFTAVYVVAGLVVTAGLRALLGIAPWLGLAVGGLLALAGLWMLTGHSLPTPNLARIIGKPRPHGGESMWSLAVFGAAYATASLSCTLAILLAVIAQALATSSAVGLVAVFAAYSLGAAAILIVVSAAATLASGSVLRRVQRLAPVMPRIAGAVLTLAGAYLIVYWAPVAVTGQPSTTPLGSVITGIAGPASAWIASHQTLVAVTAAAVVFAAIIAAAARRAKTARATCAAPPTSPGDHDNACCATGPDTPVPAPPGSRTPPQQ